MKHNKLFLYSLSSLALFATHSATAEELVTVPTLEGGITAAITGWYAVASADNEVYSTAIVGTQPTNFEVHTIDSEYDWSIDAALGYIFAGTANGIELLYRNLDSSDESSADIPTDAVATGELSYELNAGDLMISQFMDVGEHVQLRIMGGLSYVEFEQSIHTTETEKHISAHQKSEFIGWGPRVGIDARYDFDEALEGFSFVGGASLAYYLGELDLNLKTFTNETLSNTAKETLDNHGIPNFRANLGLDYVYFINAEEGDAVGLEVGYQIDYYNDVVGSIDLNNVFGTNPFPTSVISDTFAASFSGPYVTLKAVF